jgi:DNA adenine methylase
VTEVLHPEIREKDGCFSTALDSQPNSISDNHVNIEKMQSPVLPFLKWAGGKRWLVDKHSSLISPTHNRFIEPFLGSGAVFFKLQPENAILCDKNESLIETYDAIKSNWQKVESLLKDHHKKHSKEYYYSVRAKKLKSAESRAAQFIYLNRTCWNGLYRVNLNGKFNVPIGTKTNAILETDNFEGIAKLLNNCKLISGDFELALNQSMDGDFVFVDPPYTVKHNHNGFIKYNEHIFSWEDQLRLRDAVKSAISRGAKVLVTNACHDSIREIYDGIGELIELSRSSVIAGKSEARGRYEEMVIKCY